MSETCKCSLKVQNLGVRKDGRVLLHDVGFTVHHGEIAALIGRNGAGKTTLLRALLGRIPHTGSIQFFGPTGAEIRKPKIGYVPQNVTFDRSIPVTAGDLLCANLSSSPVWLFRKKAVRAEAESILRITGGKNLLDKPIGTLSGGELQRVLLAFALRPTPDLLLLDEPVSAVDNRGIEAFYELVTGLRREYHMPVILVSHNLAHVRRYTTSAILLDQTVLLTGSTEQVMHSEEVRQTFGLL